MVTKIKKALELTKSFLNESLSPDEAFNHIFDGFKSLVQYDLGFVAFLNGEGIDIKSSRTYKEEPSYREVSELGLLIRNFIKDKKPVAQKVSKGTNSIVKEAGIDLECDYSFLISPLLLRDTLFGFVLFIKQEDEFSEEDVFIADSLVSVAAYSVKDAELSEVFKMQLDILKDSVVEKSKAYDVIKQQNEKIIEADRAKNEFLANMSHELRTPLNAIIGFSEALDLKIFGDLNDKQSEYVKDIHSSGIHLLGMINDLLDIAKIEANEMKLCINKFNAINVTQESVNIIKAIADKKSIKVNLMVKGEDIQIHADQQKYQQILYNLLSNAVKFTDEGGIIDLQLDKNHGKLLVSVKDNGIGIEKKYHGKIFAKFQQVDSSYTRKHSSTGLGLAITKELVELHGGKIWVESKINQGTTFVFELPLNI